MSIILEVLTGQRFVAPKDKATGTVITQNTFAEVDPATGLVVPADASTTVATLAGRFINDISAADALLVADVEAPIKNALYLVDTTNNSDTAHDGQLMVLTDASEVNNTGTTAGAGIVKQEAVFGQPADKKIYVSIV